MNIIEITHNPFIVDTIFLVNGHEPAAGCKLSSYKESRLQAWVERLFDELSELFNGDNSFHVVFQGVESDFLDIEEAAQAAVARGMQVRVEWIQVKPTEHRLEQVRALIAEAYEHPKFANFIKDSDEIRSSIEDAFNTDFDVCVVATMSSGKSTLINAMLGCDLLPAANEATTATIARITDNKEARCFSAKRYNHDGELADQDDNVVLEKIKAWNQLTDTKQIDINGNIQASRGRPDVRLVLTDTPGPNNSQNEEHQRTTMGFIQSSKRSPLILYVLNAQQLGTNDDRNLLGLIAETMSKGGKQSKDRFIFVVNKMDVFDPEKGEDILSVLQRVRQYLISNGIQNPLIYPVSADLTRLLRKPLEQHTRKERNDFKSMADMFSEEPSMSLPNYMPITSRVHRLINERFHSGLLLKSGLPAVEVMIDEYIDKYNLPYRLKRAYDAMSEAIDVGLRKIEVTDSLKENRQDLDKLNKQIQALQQRMEKGFDTAAYKDKLEREGMVLPLATEEGLVKLEGVKASIMRQFAESFVDRKVSVTVAEKRLSEADNKLRFEHKKLINDYEALFLNTQEVLRKDLKEEYRRYIMDIFDDAESLQLPVLESVRKSVADIPFNLSLEHDEIKEAKIIISSQRVSISEWWNPFSWGEFKVEHTYGKENYVDLEEIGKERVLELNIHFNRLVLDARAEIVAGKNRLIGQFVAFMTSEFDPKFAALMASVREKTTNRKAREQDIAEAKELLIWIEAFEDKLDSTLAV